MSNQQDSQVYANIRKSSEYFSSQSQPKPFPISLSHDFDGYVIQGGPGGRYRLRDVDLYVFEHGKFHKLPWK